MRATASCSLHGPDVRRGETLAARGHRGRRTDGALSPRAAGRRRHGRPGARPRRCDPSGSRREPIAVDDDALCVARERLPVLRATTRSASRTCWRASGTYEAARRRLLPARHRARRNGSRRSRSTHRPYALDAGRSFARSSWWHASRRPAYGDGWTGSRPSSAARSSASPSTTAAPATTTEAFPVLRGARACGRRSSSCRRWSSTPGLRHAGRSSARWSAAGMEIGSHSLTHPFVHELDRGRARSRVRRVEAHPRGSSRRRRAQRVAAARLGAAGLRARSATSSAIACSARAASAGGIPATARWRCRASPCGAAWSPRTSPPSRRGAAGRSGACRRSRSAKNAAKACLGRARLAAAARSVAAHGGAHSPKRDAMEIGR